MSARSQPGALSFFDSSWLAPGSRSELVFARLDAPREMAKPKHKFETEELMSFLLGETEQGEATRIESMFLADGNLSDELELAKSALFEKYKSGTLSAQQSGVFEARFLKGELANEKENYRAMLANNAAAREGAVAGTEGAERTAGAASNSPASRPAPAPARGSRSRVMLLVLAIVLVAGAAAAVAVLGGSSESGTAEVRLSGFSVRGKSQVVALPSAERIQLQLSLSAGTRAYARYRAILLVGEERQPLEATAGADGLVLVDIDRGDLEEGQYDLELSGVESDGESEVAQVLGYYSFRN